MYPRNEIESYLGKVIRLLPILIRYRPFTAEETISFRVDENESVRFLLEDKSMTFITGFHR